MTTPIITVSPGALACVGITVAAPSSYPEKKIAGHEMVEIPGGLTVEGSSKVFDATPRLIQLSPYFIDKTAVSESQYREIIGYQGRAGAPEDHPVTMVFHHDAIKYSGKRGGGLDLPTEAQWENAARGPAENVRGGVSEETDSPITMEVVEKYVEDRLENFVFAFANGASIEGEVAKQIYGELDGGLHVTNPLKLEDELFKKLLLKGLPLFGWRVYGTPSGRLNHDEVWFDQNQKGTAPVDWGPKNAYGLYNMTGNVWEWVRDWYAEDAYMLGGVDPVGPDKGEFRILRGGTWYYYDGIDLRAGYRDPIKPRFYGVDIGFRCVSPALSERQ